MLRKIWQELLYQFYSGSLIERVVYDLHIDKIFLRMRLKNCGYFIPKAYVTRRENKYTDFLSIDDNILEWKELIVTQSCYGVQKSLDFHRGRM